MGEPKNSSRCGMVAIVGRPNVGKSTLLNRLLHHKVAIVSPVPQTTRNQIRGMYNDPRGQIIFIDTPGVHIGKDALDQYMNRCAQLSVKDADCVIYLVDTSRTIGKEEEMIANQIRNVQRTVILGLNKVDLKSIDVDRYIKFWERVKGVAVGEMKHFTMITLSGKQGLNMDKLIDIIFESLPEGPALYPLDMKSDVPQRIAIADIIREKLFWEMKEEIPHALSVYIEDMETRPQLIVIKAVIVVGRNSQKEIVIGKGGGVLKKIGTLAREELEKVLEHKVFLELEVKTQKKWRDDRSFLYEAGYSFT